jgi:hypothetical protein
VLEDLKKELDAKEHIRGDALCGRGEVNFSNLEKFSVVIERTLRGASFPKNFICTPLAKLQFVVD